MLGCSETLFMYQPKSNILTLGPMKRAWLCIATLLDLVANYGFRSFSVRAHFHRYGRWKNDKLRHIQNRPSTCTGECNSHVRRRFADKHTKMSTKMYGANLRQTSKNAKTLESGIHFWVVLKLWMAKTFEKISLFVKTISAKIFMYGRSHRYSRWKKAEHAQKTKGEASREYVFPFPTLWPCVWVWKNEIQTQGYSGTHRLSTRINAPSIGKGTWLHWES